MIKNFYTIKTTSGEEREYSHADMLGICRQYLEQRGLDADLRACENEIDDFVSRFKLIDNPV